MKGASMTELDLLFTGLRFSRDRLQGTLDAIGREPGWSPELLRIRGRPNGPHIGWHLAHVASIEDLWAHDYFGMGEPRRPDLIHRFFRGSVATEDVPPAEELLAYLTTARQDLLEAARRLDSLDRPCRMSDGRILAAREILVLAPLHESIHHGRIAALYFDLIRGGSMTGMTKETR
ncbi:MAG TPA: DinB family protein [Thermoanaerobaculia bacterium]